jgi:hypothetical protein
MPEQTLEHEATHTTETAPIAEQIADQALTPEEALILAAAEQTDSQGIDAITQEAMAKGHIWFETNPQGQEELKFDETGAQVWEALNQRSNELEAKATNQKNDEEHRQSMAEEARERIQNPADPTVTAEALAMALTALRTHENHLDQALKTEKGKTGPTEAELAEAYRMNAAADKATEAELEEAYLMNEAYDEDKATPSTEQVEEESKTAEKTDTHAQETKVVEKIKEEAKNGSELNDTITNADSMDDTAQLRRDILNIPDRPFTVLNMDGLSARLYSVPDNPRMMMVEWINDRNQPIGQSLLTSPGVMPDNPRQSLPKDLTRRLDQIRDHDFQSTPRQKKRGWRRFIPRRSR